MPAFYRVRGLLCDLALEAGFYRAWKRNLVVELLKQARLRLRGSLAGRRHGTRTPQHDLHAADGSMSVSRSAFAPDYSPTSWPVDRYADLDPGLDGASMPLALAAPLIRIGKRRHQITATAPDPLDVDMRVPGRCRRT